MTEANKTAADLIAGMDDLLSAPSKTFSVKAYWAQSISASVSADYKSGRVVNVPC
jgi:hypothetical protein